MSRCTDELGTVQPTRADVAKYWNETEDKVRIRGADNSVQPWRITSDGSVHNGISGSPQEFVKSDILRGLGSFLKSDVFGVGHHHALGLQ
jgi:hypothetical protein